VPALPARLLNLLRFGLLATAICFGLLWSLSGRGYAATDFASFLASGRAATAGQNPYYFPPTTYLVYPGDVEIEQLNLNPPLVLPLFQALAVADPNVAFYGWYLLSCAGYALALALLARAYPQPRLWVRGAWALSLAGLWQVLALGQIYVPLLLAVVAAWLLLRHHHFLPAGVLIGLLVAVKPNFVVWALFLLVGGWWGAALVAMATALLLSLLPALVYGPGIYTDWFAATTLFPGYFYPGNASLHGLAARLGIPLLGTLLSALLVGALLVWVVRRRPSVLQVSSLALVACLLASPLAWAGYSMLLLPIFAGLFAGRPWPIPLRLAAVLLAVPFPIVFRLSHLSWWALVGIGSVYGWALLLVLVAVVTAALCDDVAGSEYTAGLLERHERRGGWRKGGLTG
jgi:hypothetical protein